MHCIETRKTLLKYSKYLPQNKLATGSTGNFSARDLETGYIVIKSSGTHYSEMSLEDFSVITLDGDVVETKAGSKPSFETPTHLALYNNFSDVNSVLHTHINEAIVLAATRDVLECNLTPTGRRLLREPVPVIPFIENGTQDMADVVLDSLLKSEYHVAVMIRNHGPFITGDSILQAYERTVALRDVCEIFYQMILIGKPSLI